MKLTKVSTVILGGAATAAVMLGVMFIMPTKTEVTNFAEPKTEQTSASSTQDTTEPSYSNYKEEVEAGISEHATEQKEADTYKPAYGQFVQGRFFVSYEDMMKANKEQAGYDVSDIPQDVVSYWNSYHPETEQVNTPIDLRVNMDYAMWSKDYVVVPLTKTASELVGSYGTSMNSRSIQTDMSKENIDRALQSWNDSHPSYQALAKASATPNGGEVFTSFPEGSGKAAWTNPASRQLMSKEDALKFVHSGGAAGEVFGQTKGAGN